MLSEYLSILWGTNDHGVKNPIFLSITSEYSNEPSQLLFLDLSQVNFWINYLPIVTNGQLYLWANIRNDSWKNCSEITRSNFKSFLLMNFCMGSDSRACLLVSNPLRQYKNRFSMSLEYLISKISLTGTEFGSLGKKICKYFEKLCCEALQI